LALSVVFGVVLPNLAHAEHIRVHGTAALAKAFGGHQERELGFGAAMFGALEMPLVPEFGVEAELGAVLLAQGKPPLNKDIVPEDGAHAIHGALGVHIRPFLTDDPTDITGLTGIWLSGNVGAVTTGGLFRGMFDAHVGYDFLIEQGKYGVGPTLGYVHVFQPDSEFRPDDANIYTLGVHVMFDNAERVPPDRDHDGIIDRLDRCPDAPEDKDKFEDEDGCPDLDNDQDGIPDSADRCPNDPEDKDKFEDEDGCPDPDNDKDGILDKADKCPNEAEDVDGFEDEDGCPDPDNDQDGLPDKEDLCPNEPETKNGYADEDGCPDEDQVRVVGEKIVLDDRVHFQQNNAIIRDVSFPLLERLSKLVREHPEYVHIEVQGHADQKGPEDFNKKLSEDRAKSVLEFMVKHGVARSRLSAVGFGSSQLLVQEKNQRALFLNRRVEFVITREVRGGATPAPAPAPPAPAPPSGAAPPEEHNDTAGPSAPAGATEAQDEDDDDDDDAPREEKTPEAKPDAGKPENVK
jgi:outer membrane protein OmpA-like peptidoglycan-associated protein